jgi:hypothetical protein
MEHPLAQAAVAMPNGDTEISTMAEPVTLKRLVVQRAGAKGWCRRLVQPL